MGSTANGARSRAGRPTAIEAAQLTERLRRAAVDTFLENGYDGTTMEAVAQAAGVTKSTLYSRYPDKRTLFIAVSLWALTRQEPDERVPGPLPDDLAGGLTQIARAILARSVDPDLVRLNRMAIAESARFPEFAASSRAVTWTPRIQVIMDLLRRYERAGTVVVTDVELAAEQFFAMVGAMPALLAAYGIHRTPDVEEQHLRHAVELFLNGVLVRESASSPAQVPVGPAVEAGRRPAAPGQTATIAGSSGLADYRRLGRSGLHVSPIALGTTTFGRPGRGRDERTATELVHRYLDAGGNLVDTADVNGAAEEICGRALRGRRSRVVLATWAGMPTGHAPHDRGSGRRHLRAACEASLRRLRTDYIDLYQVRLDDPGTPLEETIDALDDLVRAGKVLHVGASSVPAYRLMKALSVSDRRARARFISLQDQYDLTLRSAEREHFPLLEEEGLGFISGDPFAAAERVPGERGARVAAAMRKASAQLGCTALQLTLAWQRTRPVTSTVVDARSVEHLEDALASLSIDIPADVAAELDRAGRPTDG